ncbi:MAG: DUF192 domain-containing protein [Comamonas sp.]|nr:DUF192 domain-containing protein [Comamonas sp.]
MIFAGLFHGREMLHTAFLRQLIISCATLLTCALCVAQEGEPQMNLARVELHAGMYRITAQVAATPRQREVGLMYRQQMPDHEGMLFVFDVPGVQCFWMKNTQLPLTAAFIADDGQIVNLADMRPQTEDSHCSDEPVRYVLEMNQGWFAKRGFKRGTRLSGPPFTRP